VQDKPGVLYRMLQPFARSRINLSKIESRPIKNNPWSTCFFSICAAIVSRRRSNKRSPGWRRIVRF
jgi:chorismate mutase/prephenate dehydratase